MEIDIKVLKFIENYALVEAVATVDDTIVATGKLGFAKRSLQPVPANGSPTLQNVTNSREGTNLSLPTKHNVASPQPVNKL